MVRRLVAVLVGVLLLAGCQDDPEPKVSEPGPSPSVVASSAVVSELPETAEGFIRRWRELAIAMQNSGDTAAYRALARGCDTCMAFADQIEGYYEAGGYVRTAGEKIESITQVDSIPSRAVFRLDLDPRPTTYLTKAGGRVEQLPGERLSFEVVLRPLGVGWRLVDYQQLAT